MMAEPWESKGGRLGEGAIGRGETRRAEPRERPGRVFTRPLTRLGSLKTEYPTGQRTKDKP